MQGGSAANTDGPTDDEDSDGRSHYSVHGSNTATGGGSNFSQTYRERRREAHTQVYSKPTDHPLSVVSLISKLSILVLWLIIFLNIVGGTKKKGCDQKRV